MSLDDILFIHEIDFNDLYKQWKKSICQGRPCDHHEQFSTQVKCLSKGSLKDSIPSSCESLKTESIEQCTVSKTESIIIDNANECLTSERLTEDEQLASDTNSRTSLFKLDKSTSIHSLPSPIIETSSNEQNSSPNRRRPHLGRHEHWITTSMNAYPHPFANHSHGPCSNERKEMN